MFIFSKAFVCTFLFFLSQVFYAGAMEKPDVFWDEKSVEQSFQKVCKQLDNCIKVKDLDGLKQVVITLSEQIKSMQRIRNTALIDSLQEALDKAVNLLPSEKLDDELQFALALLASNLDELKKQITMNDFTSIGKEVEICNFNGFKVSALRGFKQVKNDCWLYSLIHAIAMHHGSATSGVETALASLSTSDSVEKLNALLKKYEVAWLDAEQMLKKLVDQSVIKDIEDWFYQALGVERILTKGILVKEADILRVSPDQVDKSQDAKTVIYLLSGAKGSKSITGGHWVVVKILPQDKVVLVVDSDPNYENTIEKHKKDFIILLKHFFGSQHTERRKRKRKEENKETFNDDQEMVDHVSDDESLAIKLQKRFDQELQTPPKRQERQLPSDEEKKDEKEDEPNPPIQTNGQNQEGGNNWFSSLFSFFTK